MYRCYACGKEIEQPGELCPFCRFPVISTLHGDPEEERQVREFAEEYRKANPEFFSEGLESSFSNEHTEKSDLSYLELKARYEQILKEQETERIRHENEVLTKKKRNKRTIGILAPVIVVLVFCLYWVISGHALFPWKQEDVTSDASNTADVSTEELTDTIENNSDGAESSADIASESDAEELADETELFSWEDYTFVIQDNGTAKIVGFSGEDDEIYIPEILGDEEVYRVTSIGETAFSDNDNMTKVTIPDGVTSIDNYAFRQIGYATLKSIELPNSLTELSDWLFQGCTLLSDINIPRSVTSIGEGSFAGCASLSEVIIPNDVASIGDHAFYGCESINDIIIPDGITEIGNYTFYGCKGLTSIDIPLNVTSIGAGAFQECDGIKEIDIPQGVITIGEHAFDSCENLTWVDTSKGIISVGSGAFRDCTSLESIEFWDGLTSIKDSVFYNCSNLTIVEIPESVISIGPFAFWECKNLTDISTLENITAIGDYAFYGCTSLTDISIPDCVTEIGDHTFALCRNLTVSVVEGSYAEKYCQEHGITYILNADSRIPATDQLNVEKLIDQYYEAKINGDADELNKIVDTDEPYNKADLADETQFISHYDNFRTYVIPGITDNNFVVYVKYDTFFNGINTGAPSLNCFIVIKAEDGYYIYNKEISGEFQSYLEQTEQSEIVMGLKAQVESELKDACDSNKDLYILISMLRDDKD